MISSRPRKIAAERAAVKCNEWADVNCVIFVYSYQKCVKACHHIAKAKCIIHFERKRERKKKRNEGRKWLRWPFGRFFCHVQMGMHLRPGTGSPFGYIALAGDTYIWWTDRTGSRTSIRREGGDYCCTAIGFRWAWPWPFTNYSRLVVMLLVSYTSIAENCIRN